MPTPLPPSSSPKAEDTRRSEGPPALFNCHCFLTDSVFPVLGGVLLLAALPYLALQVILCTAVHKVLDFVGLIGLVKRAVSWEGFEPLVKHPGDGFIFPCMLWLCFAMPLLSLSEALHAREHGFVLWRAAAYNALRIGPMYAFFSHIYTLAHKESHARGAIFVAPLNSLGLGNVFNWVGGPFFGVLPGTFTHSHQLNHHRYHNSRADVYSTGGYPRDSLVSFCRYFCIWLMYASNFSTTIALLAEGKWLIAAEVVGATLYYCAMVAAVAYISPAWAAASLVWAFVEGNVLLCAVNWVWHGFIAPEDPTDPAVVSTTIVKGKEFIFAEEYHVVHHAFPGLHWTRYAEMYKKGAEAGTYKRALRFQDENLFVVWGCMLAKDYAGLAKLVHDPQGDWDPAEIPKILAARLQHTTW